MSIAPQQPRLAGVTPAARLPRRDAAAEPWLVVFDLDGTLIDSSLDLCLAVNAALQHVGAAPISLERLTSYVGDGAATLVRRALGESWNEVTVQHALAHFISFYREHKLDNTRLYDGVSEALTNLRELRPQLPMAVLTNKPENSSREICEALGLAQFFFANYGGNSFATKKPEPEGLLTLMREAQELGLSQTSAHRPHPATGVVLIGDSEVDVQTARLAGVRSIGCLYGLAPDRLRAATPDALCRSPREWCQLLGIT